MLAPPPWLLRDVLVPFLVTRLALLLVGVLALALLPLSPHATAPVSGWPPLDMWTRWDGGWYLLVAERGYWYVPGEQSPIVFWPLLPALMHAGAWLLGAVEPVRLAIAGVAVSNVALVLALVYLVALVRLDHDDGVAARTALYLLVFPTSFFLSAVYAESLFLLAAVGSLYHARRGEWWRAGLIAAVGALARPFGAVLALPLAVEYLHQRGFRLRAVRFDALAIGLPPLALLGWLGYLTHFTGDPLAVTEAQRVGWERELAPIWTGLARTLEDIAREGQVLAAILIVAVALSLLFVALTLASLRGARPSHAAYALAVLLIVTSTSHLASVPRFGIVLFPVFVTLALWGRREWLDRAYVPFAMALGAFLMGLFALWHWVA